MNKLKTRLEQLRNKPQTPLSASRSRAVSLTAAGWAMAGVAFLFLSAAAPVGIWMFVKAEKDQIERETLRQEATVAQAEVTQLTRTRGDNSRYYAAFRFTVSGREYKGRVSLPRSRWQRLRTGSTLEIVYRASNPASYWIPGREPNTMPFWVGPVAALTMVLVGSFLAAGLVHQGKLLSEGRSAHGRVTHTTKDQHGHIVHYEFRLPNGAVRKGKYGPVSAAPDIGGAVSIVYDPDDPKRVSKLPLTLVAQSRDV